MIHDETKVREWLELMLPAFLADKCEQEVVHTSGGSPHSFDKWPDPCDLDIAPPKSVDELMRYLKCVGADSDRQAAEWCFDLYCESALWEACEGHEIPNRAIEDVCFHTTFPGLTREDRAAEEAWQKNHLPQSGTDKERARKRAKRDRYEANRRARGLAVHRPNRAEKN